MDNVSNYLLAFGKTEKINQLQSWFDQPDEVNVVQINDGFSLLSVSKGSSFRQTTDGYVFFTGWLQDHHTESIVLGEEGYLKWSSPKRPQSKEYEGSHVFAHYSNNKMTVRNDMFSYFPVIYFIEKDLFVCSDSLFMLTKVRKLFNLPCRLNRSVMHSRAWTHGLACAVMSNDTQIEGARLLSPGKHIEVSLNKKLLSSAYYLETKNIIKETNLKELFSVAFDNYKDSIRDAAMKIAQSIMSMLYLDEVMINFGLSGGLDSRIILAAVLQKQELLENVAIKTNTHPSRKGDFDIVEKLANKFNFEFNDNEKIRLYKLKHSLKTNKIENKFSLWILSSMGIFDMMYLHDSYWPKPYIIDMGGHGAESIKGTFSAMKFEDFIKPKKVSSKAKFSRNGLRHIRESKEANRVYDAIRSELTHALDSNGINLDENASIQWHYLSYKSPIANGRFLDCSSIGIRPFIQHSLFALSISEINPFIDVKKGDPTMLHDILILLNPELAAIEFENKKSNISREYIQSRLEALGGVLQISGSQPYTVFGKISAMENGPPDSFLNKVPPIFVEDDDVKTSILKTMESVWSSIQDENTRKVYQTAYDTAKERLNNPDYYPPSAGTPAAKVISLILLD